MAEKMAEQIAKILKEPNFQTAEKALTDFCGPMDEEFRNLLVDIIVERWIDTPKDVPFSYARSIWNRKDINREEYQALLEEIRSYPIAPINKAKISDFLWVVENDFSNAKIAETAYCEHLKNTGAFADHIMAINRILFISKKIRSKDNMERTAAMEMDYFAQILVRNTFEYIRSRFVIEESDVKKIVDVSCAIPEGRKESYTKGLMFGFSGDFLTALSILIPQIENAVRYLAVECGEPVYNMNEEGIEEIKTMHAVLELEGVKESLDEDLIFALNTIFCSKFGFNMRNNVAHGMLDDQAFQSFKALYIWWFALKFCYLFCGKLQEENRSKINKKLKQLMEKKDNMDEN